MQRYFLQEYVSAESRLSVIARTVRKPVEIHWHDFVELELVTAGSGHQQLNGQVQELKRGSLSVMLPRDFHAITAAPELNLLHLAVDEAFLSPSLLARLSAGRLLVFSLDEEETATMEGLLSLCRKETQREVPNREYLRQLLGCILLRVLQLLPEDSDAESRQDDPIQAVLLYLQIHFRENPGLPRLAKIAHYSTSHFSTTFRKRMGMTCTQYLNLLKTEYAEKLLLTTDMKVTDICAESGFASPATFLRLFRRKTGHSPSSYRQKHAAPRTPG